MRYWHTWRNVIGAACLLLLCESNAVYAAEMLRFNPFEQPDMLSQASSKNFGNNGGDGMKLRGTVIDGPDSLANIGGEFYRLNQMVSGYRVTRIENGKVTLHRGSTETVLTLNDEDKRRKK